MSYREIKGGHKIISSYRLVIFDVGQTRRAVCKWSTLGNVFDLHYTASGRSRGCVRTQNDCYQDQHNLQQEIRVHQEIQ